MDPTPKVNPQEDLACNSKNSTTARIEKPPEVDSSVSDEIKFEEKGLIRKQIEHLLNTNNEYQLQNLLEKINSMVKKDSKENEVEEKLFVNEINN